ncbi:MAG: hypothetical protein AAGI11_06460 [Pseudomonadota bacterium]
MKRQRVRYLGVAAVAGLTMTLASMPVFAYIGPGAGVSFIGSLFSTLWVLVLAIFTILFWPIRYAFKRVRRLLREARQGEAEIEVEDSATSGEG